MLIRIYNCSEIAPTDIRGAVVMFNQIGIVGGICVAFWLGYGLSHWDNAYLNWRISVILQYPFAIALLAGLPFIPESPRWLVEADRIEDAVKALSTVRGIPPHDPAITQEILDIEQVVQWYRVHSVTSVKLFITNKALRNRLLRAFSLQFWQQMSGAGGIRYYLPTNFVTAGASKSLSLLATGIDGTVQVFMTMLAGLVIDRLGRRWTLFGGACGMAFCMLMEAVLPGAYPNHTNRHADIACIFFIFFFVVCYSLSFGPTAWIYGSEIFPNNSRAAGLSLAAAGQSIGAIIVGEVWPVMQANMGTRAYYVFFAFNVWSAFMVWMWFPETKGVSLEEMDSRFGEVNALAAARDQFDNVKLQVETIDEAGKSITHVKKIEA